MNLPCDQWLYKTVLHQLALLARLQCRLFFVLAWCLWLSCLPLRMLYAIFWVQNFWYIFWELSPLLSVLMWRRQSEHTWHHAVFYFVSWHGEGGPSLWQNLRVGLASHTGHWYMRVDSYITFLWDPRNLIGVVCQGWYLASYIWLPLFLLYSKGWAPILGWCLIGIYLQRRSCQRSWW